MQPLVAIIVLNWNGLADTIECVRSLQALTYPNLSLIVVDNGSRDDSSTRLREVFPGLSVIENEANLGFAEGNNVGIRNALERGAEYVLILNNDTVVDPLLVTELVAAAIQNPVAGVISPKIYYHSHPNRLWSAGGRWDPAGMCFGQIGDGEDDLGQHDIDADTEFAVGCAMFVPARTFKAIGLLEPLFFLNYEEIDFCSRILKAGLRVRFAPRAKLWHKVSASFGGESSPLKTYFTFRNRLLWAERNLSFLRIVAIHVSVYAGLWRRFGNPVIEALRRPRDRLRNARWALLSARRNPNNRAWFRGIRDYWMRQFGVCPDLVWALHQEWKGLQRGDTA